MVYWVWLSRYSLSARLPYVNIHNITWFNLRLLRFLSVPHARGLDLQVQTRLQYAIRHNLLNKH